MRINFKNMPCESKQALKTDSPDRNGPRAISVRGADAAVFLQGQITADLEKLLPGFCTYAAICSPKGRVITTLEVLRLDHEFMLILPPHLDEAVVTHLQKYILRADVQIETKSNKTGVCAWTHPHPDLPIGQCRQLDEQVTWRPRWAHYSDHNWVFGYGGKSGASESATPISWQQARILWGVTQTTPPTRENFLPQMLNMDALDGVSFDKGCYTGQEIIARTHFRGKVKRRMARFLVTKPLTINAGDELLTSADSVAGNVVDWANDDAGNTGILAVIKLAHNDEALMLHDESASPWPLPYSVD